MKNLLAIVCSPRKPSNSELFIKAVCKELGSDWELNVVRLIDWNILPCRACYKCLFDKCVQNDDMGSLVELIVNADAVALCVPTYFLGANSLLKRFIDRGLMFYSVFDKLWDKPMVGVITAGVAGMEGYAKLMVDSAIKVMGGRLLASTVVFGAFPGEAVIGDENAGKVQMIARALSSEKEISSSGLRCPLCGGDSFRFAEGKRVKCLLCSNEGEYTVTEDGHIKLIIAPHEHQFFLTYQDAMKHYEWLKQMKERFLRVRSQLKPVIKEYLHYGKSIDPPNDGT